MTATLEDRPRLRTKTFRHGGSQAVRIPKDLRLPDGEVTVRRYGRGVLVEPVAKRNLAALWAALDRVSEDFMADDRQQPPIPVSGVNFDD
jgi:antitoxin VapB